VSRARILINALSVTQGGGRSYIRNLLRELGGDPRDFSFTVLCSAGQLSEEEACGLDRMVVSLPDSNAALRTIGRVCYEQAILPFRARRFDLLYCVADILPVLAPGPSVVAIRNLNIYDRRFFDDLRVWTLEALVRLGVRRARRVVFPTQAAADQVRQRIRIPEERVRIVPHGISLKAFRDVEAEKSQVPYLFLPAVVEPHKNLEVLIESLPLLRDSQTEVWVAGSTETHPTYPPRMRALIAERGLESRVRLLGLVPYEDVLRYYRGAAALVFPSLLESFGHPLLEAMLAATPVVAADIASLREVAGDAALYFDPHEPADLARAVDRLTDEPEATRARVERGLERARLFSWKSSTDRLCGVFEEVLRESGAR